MTRAPALVLALFAALMLAAPESSAQDDGPPRIDTAKVFAGLLARMKKLDLSTVWDVALKVQDLGPEVVEHAREAMTSPEPHVKLALAKALYALDAADPHAISGLLDGRDPKAAEIAARLMGLGRDAEEKILREAAKKPLSPLVRVACAASLWDITGSEEWKGVLQGMLTSGDAAAARSAAIELGRMGDVHLVKGLLEKYRNEPSLGGRISTAILDSQEIQAAQDEVSIRKHDLFEEVASLVSNSYVDDTVQEAFKPRKIDREFLVDAAASGIASSLDRFCGYMTKKAYDEDRTRASGSYAGIGAYVRTMDFDLDGTGEKSRVLRVDRPIYTPPAPAYKAGLRSGDLVLEVFDPKTEKWSSLVNLDLQEAIEKLKGPVGTDVKVRVRHRGKSTLDELTITRAMITINVAVPDMLEAGIGYIYLKRFDNKASQDLEKALDVLETNGMKALILDLRGNPGGALTEVLDCCRKFLNGSTSMLITYTLGRTAEWTKWYYTTRGKTHPPFPMAILIDNDSASGSEMLSGAMQAYKRAVVIGETSYGKGSGQTVFPLMQSRDAAGDPQRFFRMTIFKYYLHNKTSIHQRGVKPDIEQEYDKISAFQYFWQEKLLRDDSITAFIDSVWAKENIPLFDGLARFDDFDHAKYPGFDKFYTSLDTKLDRNYVRRLLRTQIRERLQDEKGMAYERDDFQEDSQIQRAIIELLRQIRIDPKSVPQYAHFADKFK